MRRHTKCCWRRQCSPSISSHPRNGILPTVGSKSELFLLLIPIRHAYDSRTTHVFGASRTRYPSVWRAVRLKRKESSFPASVDRSMLPSTINPLPSPYPTARLYLYSSHPYFLFIRLGRAPLLLVRMTPSYRENVFVCVPVFWVNRVWDKKNLSHCQANRDTTPCTHPHFAHIHIYIYRMSRVQKISMRNETSGFVWFHIDNV